MKLSSVDHNKFYLTGNRCNRVTLQDLLIIVTGAGEVPLLGFDVPPSLEFRHEQELFARKKPHKWTAQI